MFVLPHLIKTRRQSLDEKQPHVQKGYYRGPNSSAIYNKCVSQDYRVSYSMRWTNTTCDAPNCHYINDVLLVSSQKPVSTILPVLSDFCQQRWLVNPHKIQGPAN